MAQIMVTLTVALAIRLDYVPRFRGRQGARLHRALYLAAMAACYLLLMLSCFSVPVPSPLLPIIKALRSVTPAG